MLYWLLSLCLDSENGSCTVLRKVGELLLGYTASNPEEHSCNRLSRCRVFYVRYELESYCLHEYRPGVRVIVLALTKEPLCFAASQKRLFILQVWQPNSNSRSTSGRLCSGGHSSNLRTYIILTPLYALVCAPKSCSLAIEKLTRRHLERSRHRCKASQGARVGLDIRSHCWLKELL
jgi:hypothetical protein